MEISTMKKITSLISLLLLTACQTHVQQTPVAEMTPLPKPAYSMPVAGGIETLYVTPLKMPFQARMDTGAETSSIDAKNMRPFERDGEKWISFDIVNRKNGEKHHFEKRIKRKTKIVRPEISETRYTVNMNIKMGREIITAEFTLADRERFDYQVLIGRNIINGRFIIDPTTENTMH